MTLPKIETKSSYGSRFYVNPETGDTVPGVTSILNMLPKPFLKPWAAKVVAETAVDQLPEIMALRLRDGVEAAVNHLKGSPDRFTKSAADVGTDVHDMFERMAKGSKLSLLNSDPLAPYANHFNEFLTEFSPEFVMLEETVWSDTHGYAGSFDAIMRVGSELVIADWKTTRSGVHEEVALQLAAYKNADYVLKPNGTKIELPQVDGGAVLHVRPEGWALYPVNISDEVFAHFLNVKQVFAWEKELKKGVIGRPLNAEAPRKKRGK